MLARRGQMLMTGELMVEQLGLELVSSALSCLRHSMQLLSHSSMLCI